MDTRAQVVERMQADSNRNTERIIETRKAALAAAQGRIDVWA